jgi:dipeptidyl aminopeptidase/acylaminoacyl peptidase
VIREGRVQRIGWIIAVVCLATAANAQSPQEPKPELVSAIFGLQLEPPEFRKLFEIPEYRSCGSLRMAPDGNGILFDAYKSQIGEGLTSARVLYSTLDGRVRKELCKGAMPTMSPDGKRFACSRYDDRGVWIMQADGKSGINLDPTGWGIQWSPVNASEVLYLKNGRLVVADVDAGTVRDVFPAGKSPFQTIYYNSAWSSDGRQLAILGEGAAGRELAIVDATGAEFGFQVHLRARASAALNWHPDGNQVLFPMRTSENRYEIRRIRLDDRTGESAVVAGLPPHLQYIGVCCHPDGNRIFVLAPDKPSVLQSPPN